MQKLSTTLLLLPILFSAACDSGLDNSDQNDMSSPGVIDTVRVELEVVGPGKISIVSPARAECTEAQGICNFEFDRGTEILLTGDFAGFPGGWAEDCTGRDKCRLILDRDSMVVASFGEEPDRGSPDLSIPGDRTPDNTLMHNEVSGYDVIIDTFTGAPHGHRQEKVILKNRSF